MYIQGAIYFFCPNNPDSEWFQTDSLLKGASVYRMKEAKGGLAEFLDDTIQLSTIVLLILLEADTKFE